MNAVVDILRELRRQTSVARQLRKCSDAHRNATSVGSSRFFSQNPFIFSKPASPPSQQRDVAKQRETALIKWLDTQSILKYYPAIQRMIRKREFKLCASAVAITFRSIQWTATERSKGMLDTIVNCRCWKNLFSNQIDLTLRIRVGLGVPLQLSS